MLDTLEISEVVVRRSSVKKDIFESFSKITGKHLRWICFFSKGLERQPETLLKERLQRRCFPMNFAKSFGEYLCCRTSADICF